jgi:hypothetical protein
MKRLAVLAMSISLSSCGGDREIAAQTPINPSFLEDAARVQEVANRLGPSDSNLFKRYVAGRSLSAAMGAPWLLNSEGKAPASVKEAIALQRWSDEINERERLAQATPYMMIQAARDWGLDDEYTIDDYQRYVQAYNEAEAAAQAERDAGPPAGLGT